jgi:hypothetical protein
MRAGPRIRRYADHDLADPQRSFRSRVGQRWKNGHGEFEFLKVTLRDLRS